MAAAGARARPWALSALALAVACGRNAPESRVAFSQVEVQAYLEREAARTLPGLAVGAASCPAAMPQEVGGTTTCTVEVERVLLRYAVQRLVADRFEARPEQPVVLVRDLATAVRSKLEAPNASVSCGDAAVVQPGAGQPITCQITGSGPQRSAVVQVGPDGVVTVTDA